jgi:hypothetical protein
MIRHVVLYTYRSDIPAEEIAKIYRDLQAICKRLPGQLNYTWGKYDTENGLTMNKGYTHALVCDFADRVAQKAFMEDPERTALSKHEVVPRVVGGAEGIVSFDFCF